MIVSFHPALLDILCIIAGIALLYIGAEGLIKGALDVAIRLGLTPLMAGLTVVALGTSMPEAAGSFYAQVRGSAGSIAIGNVIGSNIANVGLILGLAAFVSPVVYMVQIRAREMPIVLTVSVLFFVFLIDQYLGRIEGIILLALLVTYLVMQVVWGKRENIEVRPPHLQDGFWYWLKDFAFLVGGAAILVLGAAFLVDGASDLALAFGISDRIIGLTIVAIGTSLPELATTLLAASRGHPEIAMGNVLGSNILNILFVAGGVATISPITFAPRLLYFDAPIMIAFTVILWILTSFGNKITRPQGFLLIALYVAYISAICLFKI